MKKLILLYTWFIRSSLYFLPDQPILMRFRGWLYGFAMPSVGRGFQVSASAILRNIVNLNVGDNVYIAPNVVINAIDEISLGSEVMVAFNSVLVSGDHTKIDGSYRYGKSKLSPIKIGTGSWIGANATILKGVEVGNGTLIAAGSVVPQGVYPTGVYGGVPAKIINKEARC